MKCNTGDLYEKSVEKKLQIWLQSDKNIEQSTRRFKYTFYFGGHKFAIKVFLWTLKYFYIVDGDI